MNGTGFDTAMTKSENRHVIIQRKQQPSKRSGEQKMLVCNMQRVHFACTRRLLMNDKNITVVALCQFACDINEWCLVGWLCNLSHGIVMQMRRRSQTSYVYMLHASSCQQFHLPDTVCARCSCAHHHAKCDCSVISFKIIDHSILFRSFDWHDKKNGKMEIALKSEKVSFHSLTRTKRINCCNFISLSSYLATL